MLSGAPYGYRYVRRGEDSEARYDIVEREATVVRELFRRYVEENESIAGLTRYLGEQGIATSTGKSRWDRSTVWGMLRNPAYCGRAAFGKTRQQDTRAKVTRPVRRCGKRMPVTGRITRDQPTSEWIEIRVPAIVSEQVFELAARRLGDNQRFASRHTKVPSLLQGLVACADCGYSYYRTATRTKKRKLYYYRCLGSDDYRYEHGRLCSNRPVRQDYLDELVWGHIMKLLADPALIRDEIERRLHELRATNPAAAEKSGLELELSRCARTITRLLQAYQEELVSLEELRERMPELRKRNSTLRTQLDALEMETLDQQTYVALAENLENFLRRLREGAEKSSIEERQRVVRLLVKEVLVSPERIAIRHSIPTRNPDLGGSYPLCGRSQDAAVGCTRVALMQRAVPQYDICLQPSLDVQQSPSAVCETPDCAHDEAVIQSIKELVDIQIKYPVVTPAALAGCRHRIQSRTAGAIPVRVLVKMWFDERLQVALDRGLCNAVTDRWDPQFPDTTSAFGISTRSTGGGK